MPIDTAAKRRSAAGLSFWVVGPGVTADATPGAEWRQQAGWGYSGIAAGAVVVATSTAHYPGWQAVMLHHSHLVMFMVGGLWRA